MCHILPKSPFTQPFLFPHLQNKTKQKHPHLQELLLLDGAILINVHLGDEVPEFVVADLYLHVLQSPPQVVNADVAVLVLVEALEDLGVVFGLLVAEVDGRVPYLTGCLKAHGL